MKKIYIQNFLLSSTVAVSLLLFTNEAHADSYAINKDVELKDSNSDTVSILKRGDIVKAEIVGEVANVDYEFGEYRLDPSYLFRMTEQTAQTKQLKEDTMLFSSPNLFSPSLGTVALSDTNSVEFVVEEGLVKGWQKIKLLDGRTGYITEASVDTVIIESDVIHKRFTQVNIQREGISIPQGEEVRVIRLTSDGYVVEYKSVEVSLLMHELGVEKPVVDYAAKLIEFSKTKLDLPYVWGGNGGADIGYDCSGFTKAVFGHIGIELPRTAATQSVHGVEVFLENLMPGDLLYFETYKPGVSHVGIYIGEGMMIHAGGDHVQIQSIYTPYYHERYLFSKRVL